MRFLVTGVLCFTQRLLLRRRSDFCSNDPLPVSLYASVYISTFVSLLGFWWTFTSLGGRNDTLGKLLEVGFQSELQYRVAKNQTVEA
jgi:hypothetical protein